MMWLGAGGWVALLSKMQSEDVLVRLWVGLGGRFRACGAAGPDVGRFRACGSDGRFRDLRGFGPRCSPVSLVSSGDDRRDADYVVLKWCGLRLPAAAKDDARRVPFEVRAQDGCRHRRWAP